MQLNCTINFIEKIQLHGYVAHKNEPMAPHAQVQWPLCQSSPQFLANRYLEWDTIETNATLYSPGTLHSAAKKGTRAFYWLHEKCIDVFMKERIHACVCMIF